ncbi:MAG: hypothetical protein EKK61_02420 [Rickettsiales bacterium]|nr:MAG: hypothetical protein EKK61_02420 [Rickettsiales bacterium]
MFKQKKLSVIFKDLIKAAKKNDIKKVHEILNRKNHETIFEDNSIINIFKIAIKNNSPEMIQELLNYHPKLRDIKSLMNEDNYNLLDLAYNKNNLEIIKLLLEHGAQEDNFLSNYYDENIKKKVDVSKLAYKIYVLSDLDSDDKELIKEIQNDKILSEILFNTIKNYLLYDDHLPRSSSTLVNYSENIKQKYNELDNQFLVKIIKIIEDVSKESYNSILSVMKESFKLNDANFNAEINNDNLERYLNLLFDKHTNSLYQYLESLDSENRNFLLK